MTSSYLLPSFDLSGKVSVITGAAQGIGEVAAHVFAGLGSKVAILDVQPQVGEAVAAAIRADGGSAVYINCDVSSESDVRAAADRVARELGSTDVLINNAGVISWTPLEDLPLEEWERVCAINLRGVFLCAKHFGRQMLAKGAGSIIGVSSVAGTVPEPAAGAYAATKAGVIVLARQLAVEWGSRGVRSNCVSPGMIMTPMSARFMTDADALEKRRLMTASRRIGKAEEAAALMAFLASDSSSYVNGQNIEIDGGLMQMMIRLLPRPGVKQAD